LHLGAAPLVALTWTALSMAQTPTSVDDMLAESRQDARH